MKKLFFILVTFFLFNNVFAQHSNEYMMRNKNEKISLDLNQDRVDTTSTSFFRESCLRLLIFPVITGYYPCPNYIPKQGVKIKKLWSKSAPLLLEPPIPLSMKH